MSLEHVKSGDAIAFKSQTNNKWYIGTVEAIGNSCPGNLDIVKVELNGQRCSVVDIDLSNVEGHVIERELAPGEFAVPLEKYRAFKSIAEEVVREGNKAMITIPQGAGVVVDIAVRERSTKVVVWSGDRARREVVEINSHCTWPSDDRVWHSIRLALKKFMGIK